MDPQHYSLPDDHGWTAQPGCQVLVLERGALRLDYPEGWQLTPGETSVKLAGEDCVLEVSVRRVKGLVPDSIPIHELLTEVLPEISSPEFQERRAHNYRLLWIEHSYLEASTQQPACSCTALVLATNLHGLLTFTFFESVRDAVRPAWDTVLASLQMGLHIPDPRTGRAVDPSAN